MFSRSCTLLLVGYCICGVYLYWFDLGVVLFRCLDLIGGWVFVCVKDVYSMVSSACWFVFCVVVFVYCVVALFGVC